MSSLFAASSAAPSAVSSPIASSAATSAAANMASVSSPNHEVALVAPRPVRISHAAFFHVQHRDADYSSDFAGSGSHSSPGAGIKLAAFSSGPERTSPRLSSPSEALEEFLSILTPSFMRKPRAFPAFDPRHQRSSSLTTTTYGYNRASQPSTSPVASRASPPALQILQEQLASRGDGTRTPPRLDASHWPFGGGRSQNPILASPVSRLHTRNPFYLHHDSPGAGPGARFPLVQPQLPPLSPSPSRSQSQTPALMRPLTPVTPHAVPLPSPSPDELSERLELSSI